MADIDIKTEKTTILQCPKCKTIYTDEFKCVDCSEELIEICTVLTDAY